MENQPARRKRPFGVYAIVFLLVLRALALALEIARVQQNLMSVTLPPIEPEVAQIATTGVAVVAIAAICIGLFLLKRWAWIAAMILIGFNLLLAIAQYLAGEVTYGAMLLDVICVFYLNQRSVQAAFEGRPTPPTVTA